MKELSNALSIISTVSALCAGLLFIMEIYWNHIAKPMCKSRIKSGMVSSMIHIMVFSTFANCIVHIFGKEYASFVGDVGNFIIWTAILLTYYRRVLLFDDKYGLFYGAFYFKSMNKKIADRLCNKDAARNI